MDRSGYNRQKLEEMAEDEHPEPAVTGTGAGHVHFVHIQYKIGYFTYILVDKLNFTSGYQRIVPVEIVMSAEVYQLKL